MVNKNHPDYDKYESEFLNIIYYFDCECFCYAEI